MEAACLPLHTHTPPHTTWKVFDLRIKERKITCGCLAELTGGGGRSSKVSLVAQADTAARSPKPGSWEVSQPRSVASYRPTLTSGEDLAGQPSNGATGRTPIGLV